MDRIAAMQLVVAVAQLGGFAPAARRLRISAPVATRTIASLEEHLGARLFQRTTRSVRLTDAGRRYLERIRYILDELDEAEQAVAAERTEPVGHFRVTAPEVFGRLHVAPVMCHLLRRHPRLTGELTLADRIVNLVDEGVDAAVRIGTLEDSSAVARTLGATRRVVVASPEYLREHGTPQSPAQLAGHQIIQFTSITPSSEWRFFEGKQERRFPLSPRYVTNNADAAIGHAEQAGGLTMVLHYQVANAVLDGRLHIVLSDFEPRPLPIQIVFPSKRLLSAHVRAFIELVQETCDWKFV
jgi:DNA-binding transcriptional LysR family regulator